VRPPHPVHVPSPCDNYLRAPGRFVGLADCPSSTTRLIFHSSSGKMALVYGDELNDMGGGVPGVSGAPNCPSQLSRREVSPLVPISSAYSHADAPWRAPVASPFCLSKRAGCRVKIRHPVLHVRLVNIPRCAGGLPEKPSPGVRPRHFAISEIWRRSQSKCGAV
jgi:hypothetical protein